MKRHEKEKSENPKKIPFGILLPKWIVDRVREEAAINRRTISGQVELILERYFEENRLQQTQ